MNAGLSYWKKIHALVECGILEGRMKAFGHNGPLGPQSSPIYPCLVLPRATPTMISSKPSIPLSISKTTLIDEPLPAGRCEKESGLVPMYTES